MSKLLIGNIYLCLSVISASIGQVLLKALFSEIPIGLSGKESARFILMTERVWRAGFVGILIVAAFIFWLLCLHKLPLSYAYPMACSSVLVVALFCVIFLGETVSWRLWCGTLLIFLVNQTLPSI